MGFIFTGIGELLWDVFPGGRQMGGAPANFAYHAHCLGAQGYLVSCVGADDLGTEILECLDKLELDRKFVALDKEHPTGTVTVQLDKDGTPDYTIHENVAWDFIPAPDELLEFAPTVDAVCFGSLSQRSHTSRNTISQFLRATREDCIRIFDVNIRHSYYSEDIIRTMLDITDVLKVNDEELPLVARLLKIEGTEDQMLEEMLNKYHLRLIVLTKGAQGSVLFADGHHSRLDSAQVQIADTVGAGDAFTAAVAVGLLHQNPLDRIHAHANRLAGFVCSKTGATPQLDDSLKNI